VIPDLVEALYQDGRPADNGVLIQELEGGDDADRATAVILRVLVEPDQSDVLGRGDEGRSGVGGPSRGGVRPGLGVTIRACAWMAGDAVESHDALLPTYQIAQSLGRRDLLRGGVLTLVASAWFSGTSASETLELMDDIEDWLGDKAGPLLSASLHDARAFTEYLAGLINAEEKRSQSHRSTSRCCNRPDRTWKQYKSWASCRSSRVDGDLAVGEQIEQRVIEEYERIGDRNSSSTCSVKRR
jgi:hypothetical protein